jgi:hypothetical protein
MTPPNILKQARPADFVGEFTDQLDANDTPVPVVEVYKGEVPGGALPQNARIYEFLPLPGAENGDIADAPLAAVAVEGIHRAGGHVDAHLTLVVNGDRTPEAIERNPVTEGSGRFTRLMEVLTREEGVDRLHMSPSDTNLPPNSLRRLGFHSIEGSEELQLDLPVTKQAV